MKRGFEAIEWTKGTHLFVAVAFWFLVLGLEYIILSTTVYFPLVCIATVILTLIDIIFVLTGRKAPILGFLIECLLALMSL